MPMRQQVFTWTNWTRHNWLKSLEAMIFHSSLRWRHNGRDSVSNHQLHDCLLNRLFRRRSKKTSKLRVTGLCVGNSPGTGEFPAQMASNAENASIWWRHHGYSIFSFPSSPQKVLRPGNATWWPRSSTGSLEKPWRCAVQPRVTPYRR